MPVPVSKKLAPSAHTGQSGSPLHGADYNAWLERQVERMPEFLVPFDAERLQAEPRPSLGRRQALAEGGSLALFQAVLAMTPAAKCTPTGAPLARAPVGMLCFG